MRNKLEFYYDCSSPWTYLAFEQVCRLGEDLEISWKPILVGGIFNSINPSVYAARENPIQAKLNYAQKDLQDWAKTLNVQIGSPSVFPVNSAKAMRGALVAAEESKLVMYSRLIFKAYWGDDQDISQLPILKSVVEALQLNWEEFATKIESPSYKALLRQNTDELIDRGGFGSPTYFLNGSDMFFGNDRIDLMLKKIL